MSAASRFNGAGEPMLVAETRNPFVPTYHWMDCETGCSTRDANDRHTGAPKAFPHGLGPMPPFSLLKSGRPCLSNAALPWVLLSQAADRRLPR